MHNFGNKDLLSSCYELTNVLDENFEHIQEFVNKANTRLDAIISMKIVDNIDEAIQHIAEYAGLE